ncbi:MAG: EAL domain-containing protein [Lachnospiraceae bacterium]|nr:EAL domain-containing protein [Lachnospiraceae bacterium]
MGEPLSTIYALYFQIRIINALLLGIIWFLYLKNKRLPFEKGNFFTAILVYSTSNVICDFAITYNLYTSGASNGLIREILYRFFMITICLSMYFVHMHIEALCNKYDKSHRRNNMIVSLPLMAAVTGGIFAPIEISVGENGVYSYGTVVNLEYVTMGIYFFLSVIFLVLNHKKLKKRKTANIAMGLGVWAGFGIIQILNPSLLLSSTGIIILELMNFLNFEDSKVYINYENGCFNSMAYRKMLNSYFNENRKFYVAQISFHEFHIVHGKYGHDICQKILSDIGNIVENTLGIKVYSVEEEVIGIIIDKNNYDEEEVRSLASKIEYGFTFNASVIHVTGTIDMIYCPDEAKSVPELEDIFSFMQRYRDRQQSFYRYDKNMYKEKERYSDILRILDNAINNDGFYMVYQPIYSVKKGDFHSAEALIRLKDNRTIGFISPEEFIPIAEKEGLIMKIGEIALSKVCEFSQRANLIGRGIEYIEINLSAVQCIDQGLARQIKDTVYKYGLPYNFLNLEITETAATSSGNMLNRNVEALRDMGASFSMDDFGTGYSNLAQMVDIQYELIKIDKSLIWCCYPEQRKKILMKTETEEKRDASITKSVAVLTKIIELINDLKLKIVAEGVETKEMVDALSEKGVDYLQGYYFSKPLAEEEFLSFLESAE